MAKIFISYRRVDSAPYAGRIYDHLTAHFGKDQVFMDIDTIKPGVDFVEVLEEAVQQCDALIAVIGRQWLTVTDAAGNRRLDDPHDFTRLEVEAALNRNIRVFPVLVDGTEMPRTDALPATMAKLTRRNALTISNERFSYDINKLISALGDVINPPAITATPPSPVAEPVRVAPQPAHAPIVKIPEKDASKEQISAPIIDRSERKRGIWLNLYFLVPFLGTILLVSTFLFDLRMSDQLAAGEALIALFSAVLGMILLYGILEWKKWGIYALLADLVVISMGTFSTLASSSVSSLAAVICATAFIFLWPILRNKWKYFEGPPIRILGLKL